MNIRKEFVYIGEIGRELETRFKKHQEYSGLDCRWRAYQQTSWPRIFLRQRYCLFANRSTLRIVLTKYFIPWMDPFNLLDPLIFLPYIPFANFRTVRGEAIKDSSPLHCQSATPSPNDITFSNKFLGKAEVVVNFFLNKKKKKTCTLC